VTEHDLQGVIDSGMCIGCGACVAAEPGLELVLDDRTQTFRPSGPGGERAASVCPAVQVDFMGLQERLFPGQEITPHGAVEGVFLAQSTDHDRNRASSSGGLIKELLIAYFKRDGVDGAIALDHVAGLEFRARMVNGFDEIDTLPGSIYHSVPFDDALRLLEDNEGSYVLVAIPCQLEGIFTYIYRYAPHLADRIHATIGLLCGWQYSWHGLRAICEYTGIDFDAIEDVDFRGGGPVGRLEFTTPDGVQGVSRRVNFSYQVAFDRSFNNPRCHVCVNHHNMLADIVVGDAWLPSTVFTRTGISLVVCRKPETRERLLDLVDDGTLKAAEVTVDEITESQSHRVLFGDFAYPYADYLKETGEHCPDMEAQNRQEADEVSRRDVARFHKDLVRKLDLQAQRRYRYLWWRKLVKESPRLAKKYLLFFFVRIVRIKSLLGKREEVPREKVRIFR
jgi:coenzyme F420 hydrogenase subunit beta